MSAAPKKANDDSTLGQTVVQQVLGAFYKTLGAKPEFAEIAERLKNETSHSEAAVRRALFGDDGND